MKTRMPATVRALALLTLAAGALLAAAGPVTLKVQALSLIHI